MANQNAQYKQDLNFFSVLRDYEKEQKKGDKKTGLAPIITLIAVAVVGVVYMATLAFQNVALDTQMRSLKQYVQNPENMAVYESRNAIKSELSSLVNYNKSCEQYIAELQKAPRLARQNYENVRSLMPADTSVLAFGYTEPVLSIRCETTDKKAPAAYAQALVESKRFIDVRYTGFDATNDPTMAEQFIFTIECRLW